VVFLDPRKADVQFGQLPPPRQLEYDVTSMGDDLGGHWRHFSERSRSMSVLGVKRKTSARSEYFAF
jgi:hypothetical protein